MPSFYQPEVMIRSRRMSRTFNTGSNMFKNLSNKMPVCDSFFDICGGLSVRRSNLITGSNPLGYKDVCRMNHGHLDTGKQPDNCLDLIIMHGKPSWVNL